MPRKKTVLPKVSIFKPSRNRITIPKARKILGDFGKDLTDEKIEALLDYMYAMAEIEYDHIMEQREKMMRGLNHQGTSEPNQSV
jgi:uncharacterized protein YjgD (DUF1641 family)